MTVNYPPGPLYIGRVGDEIPDRAIFDAKGNVVCFFPYRSGHMDQIIETMNLFCWAREMYLLLKDMEDTATPLEMSGFYRNIRTLLERIDND